MALTPGGSVRVRTRGGRECEWVVPDAGTQRFRQLEHAIEVGDVAVLDADEPAQPDEEDTLEQLRAELERRTGEEPDRRLKEAGLRRALSELDETE